MFSNTSFILSNDLSTGEITFIARVCIQLFSYLGVYLLALIVLGNAPKTASLETHDLLNRFVGQSSTFLFTLRWMWHRITGRRRDPVSAWALGAALALALLFGVTVGVSDIGLIGIHSCTTAGPTLQDFPASIRSDSDALALVTANLLNGTDPSSVNAYRCDSTTTVTNLARTAPGTAPLPTAQICSGLHNSTYADALAFQGLNSTDSDVLMPKFMFSNANFSGNWYLAAPTSQIVREATVRDGLAVIPHDMGVSMVAGVPDLSTEQQVSIDQTLALEIEVGCMSLGIVFTDDLTQISLQETLIPDSDYLPTRLTAPNYSGPSSLQAPLAKAADKIRAAFANKTGGPQTGEQTKGWQLQVATSDNAGLINGTDHTALDECTADIVSLLAPVGGPEAGLAFQANQTICHVVNLVGARAGQNTFSQTADWMVCATTTQVNMVSASLAVDAAGSVSANITRLPSNINVVQALLYNQSDPSAVPDPAPLAPLIRFTLSPNPAGASQHFIYQAAQLSLLDQAGTFSRGSGNIGAVFMQLAANIWATDAWPGIGLIDSNFFAANFSAAQVTRWAEQVGASFVLGSVGYNGWAARGARALAVVSTGGHPATCYSGLYALGFVPLVGALLAVLGWIVLMGVTARLREARRMQERYGGLAPHIDVSSRDDLRRHTLLQRVDGPTARFEPVDGAIDVRVHEDMESRIMIQHSRNSSAEKALVLHPH
ncbi:hypothetical protein CVT26_002286 [Gymnopilus dilepis]|uniref:Uncharacterized protein n=1 Tax=Gymnopilus dilepis TaxID=231916 RepID=A0A409YN04_9AGAR|nr:hypothetical protein CVT26_002286 [Gymnopilus dilepis]